MREINLWNRRRVDRIRINRAARRSQSFKGNLVVLAIMKNEGLVLQEWINHYLSQGASKIILIDNGSTDDSINIAREYENKGIVECISRHKRWHQRQHYWAMLKKFKIAKSYEWLLIADLDEFWFVKDGRKISEVLTEYPETDIIYVNWSVFGSNGYIQQPKSVRRELVLKQEALGPHKGTKYLCRPSCIKNIKQLQIHKVHGVCSSRVVSDNVLFQINHYVTQSEEYFEKVKMTRGDANNPIYDTIRDWKYFENINKNCNITDTNLAEQVDEYNKQKTL